MPPQVQNLTLVLTFIAPVAADTTPPSVVTGLDAEFFVGSPDTTAPSVVTGLSLEFS